MKKVLSFILSIIVISYCISLIQVTKGKQKLPTVLGFTGVTIISGSMEPEVSVGDYVIIKKPKKEDIQKGTIITFEQNNILVTHRVEDVIDDGLYSTKGDANNIVDSELVRFENIVGISILVFPKLGDLLLWLRTTPGIISIFIGTVLFILWPTSKKANKIIFNK